MAELGHECMSLHWACCYCWEKQNAYVLMQENAFGLMARGLLLAIIRDTAYSGMNGLSSLSLMFGLDRIGLD